MPIFSKPLPLTLYIHLPWCVKKCPYCDFNSHQMGTAIPEDLYLAALIKNLTAHRELMQHRLVEAVFFGGGTPSLFSARTIGKLIEQIAKLTPMTPDVEITLEANPGTVDQIHFKGYKAAGINRLSLGIQSFQKAKLKALGRIHDDTDAQKAIDITMTAGFTNFNIDLMYGLPEQTIADALFDLETALTFKPKHLSWYQLTLEPNTLFYQQPPPLLPADDLIWNMQEQGQALLAQHGLEHYEVSAYALADAECKHNRNYWEFGDYIGIGAGAHSKITDTQTGAVKRFFQSKHPKDYLSVQQNFQPEFTLLRDQDLKFEFMLNALRLSKGVPVTLFQERTGLDLAFIKNELAHATAKRLLEITETRIKPTPLGFRFLNNLVGIFL